MIALANPRMFTVIYRLTHDTNRRELRVTQKSGRSEVRVAFAGEKGRPFLLLLGVREDEVLAFVAAWKEALAGSDYDVREMNDEHGVISYFRAKPDDTLEMKTPTDLLRSTHPTPISSQ